MEEPVLEVFVGFHGKWRREFHIPSVRDWEIVRSLTVDPFGRWLVSAASDGSVAAFNLANGRRELTLEKIPNNFAIAILPDGSHVYVGGISKLERIGAEGMNPEATEPASRFLIEKGFISAAMAGNRNLYLAVCDEGVDGPSSSGLRPRIHGQAIDGGADLFEIELEGEAGPVRALGLKPDGSLIAVFQDEIRMLDGEDGSERSKIRYRSYPLALSRSVSLDGKILTVADGNDLVHLVDIKTGRGILNLRGARGWAVSAALGADRRYLYSAGWGGIIREWRIPEGALSKLGC